jgi:hypothetical protein
MLENYSNEKRKNLSFHIVSAIREALNIAKKTSPPVTYEQAFDTLYDLNEELYTEVIRELPQQNQNETAKLFIAKAQLLDEQDAVAAALKEIQKEFDENEALLRNTDGNTDAKRRLQARQATLLSARKSLQERRIREHRILQRDFSKIERADFGAQFIEEDDFKVDYRLDHDSFLRLRLLHPENMEAVTGADLVYEQQDIANRKIRVMFLQYKIWDENGVIYFSQGSLEAQLRKMKNLLCENGFCNSPGHLRNQIDYRFPYCSCFLRPTDQYQETNTKLISSGIHIPVCAALNIREEGALSLEKKYLRTQTLNHQMFEPLFNKGFIGSRWLSEDELRQFYVDNGILSSEESLLIYAREVYESEENPF